MLMVESSVKVTFIKFKVLDSKPEIKNTVIAFAPYMTTGLVNLL